MRIRRVGAVAAVLACAVSLPSRGNAFTAVPVRRSVSATTATQLHDLVNVPDHFFAITLPTLGIVSAWTNKLTRRRLEERAWEQRVEEARERRLRNDPTVTEIELRRQEAAVEWSAYGKPRQQQQQQQQQRKQEEQRRKRRVAVADPDLDYAQEQQQQQEQQREEEEERRTFRMTDDEIDRFELEYGIDFDPYYDDPYTEEELPSDVGFRVDKKYGDRIYDNGEIFYKDRASGLFYRQGAKPRSLSFWK